MKKRNQADYRRMTVMNEYTEIARSIDAAMILLNAGICDRRGKAYYASLLNRISRMVVLVGNQICEEADEQAAYKKYGRLLTEALAKRGAFKRLLMLKELTPAAKASGRRITGSKVGSVYYLRSLINEFGSAIHTDGGRYDVWSAVPFERISRETVNSEMEALLSYDPRRIVSSDSMNSLLLKIRSYEQEMNLRAVDCWHVLMINEQTGLNPEIEKQAFRYLREALLFHERLISAGKAIRLSAMKVAQ